MGLDFDVTEFIKDLKKQATPNFTCPIQSCQKSYKTIVGLKYHLSSYDHDNPATPLVGSPIRTPLRKKGNRKLIGAPKTVAPTQQETLTFCGDTVQFHIDEKIIRLSINDELDMMTTDEYEAMLLDQNANLKALKPPEETVIKLPEASFKEVDDYNISDAPPRQNAYIRFIEKSAEELDGEIEYDVDEEDTMWLDIMNSQREQQNLNPISVDTLELLMDRLEKESYFQAAANGQSGANVDDDAVCCICMDGECQNTNVILFCDMCNLAVHQDCYGVPYIPEGQWLCRRCLQSPSRPVDCVLCPNVGGAFKQTDNGFWAHVVCALWIPEVRFANTVFLEPIDSIEMIPAARWRLTCYICKQKGIGACIQCNRNNCYAAFHVTCAQQAGLTMRMGLTDRTGQPAIVQKSAFCHAHTPPNVKDAESPGNSEKAREECRNKMKMARKLLAKKRTCVPIILIPTIPADRVQEIAGLVNAQKKMQFINRLIAYWTLKRQYRNGVPLLRRLQTQSQGGGFSRGVDGSPDARELYQQLKYWQCLRQDLERARLLCELVRKREKVKLAFVKIKEQCFMMQLNPLEAALRKILDQLKTKDSLEIFLEPVDVNEVPDYRDVVTHPMDLGTMQLKLDSGLYQAFEEFEADFQLMVKNCLAYNNKDTIFYKSGMKMKDQGNVIFRAARKELEQSGLLEQQDLIAQSIDEDFKTLQKQQLTGPSENGLQQLQTLLDRANLLKHALARIKRVKMIKNEMARIKKVLLKSDVHRFTQATDSSQSDVDFKMETSSHQTPVHSPIKSVNSNISPSGVNRRTAVLFTRKAQAAAKRPDPIVKEESSMDAPSCDDQPLQQPVQESPILVKKVGRKKHGGRKSSETDGFMDRKKQLQKSSSRSSFEAIPDSFRVYRGQDDNNFTDSDDDGNLSFTGSECSSCSGFSSGTGSEYGSSLDDSDGSELMSTDCEQNDNATIKSDEDQAKLEPLQLVWAKCRGYPWYPALIIDPQMPKGFLHNGVPLPAPPTDVLNLKKNYDDPVFLVLFFDLKRTWQWLPSNKLELLGIHKDLDQTKLTESRKPTERKAVKKAYQDALHYQSQVSSADGPIGKL